MTDEDDSAIVRDYARQLRESEKLQILIEEAPLVATEALEFNPNAEETEEVKIENTDQGTLITIIDRVEVTDEELEFTGYTKNTVEGHLVDCELQSVSLRHEFLHGPLYGAGTEFTYEDGEITTEYIWVS